MGCNNARQGDGSGVVSLGSSYLTDTAHFSLGGQRQCQIVASAQITYPVAYGDESTTGALRGVYLAEVLDAEDNGDLDAAMGMYTRSLIDSYGEYDDELSGGGSDEDEVSVSLSSTISVVCNNGSFLSFCKELVDTKGGDTAMVTRTYCNISLPDMAVAGLPSLFEDGSLGDIALLLKYRLMEQNGVKSEAELIDLGYFNLDNLTVTNNFSIGDEGITWTYNAYEIACYSVGGTDITLSYDALEPYIIEGSAVAKLM